MRNCSRPLLRNVSWDAKYFDCDKRINHLQKIKYSQKGTFSARKLSSQNNTTSTYITLRRGTFWFRKLLTTDNL